jgi:uncharacterized protein (TIGR03437 family)
VNGASFQPGIAPGEWITIEGLNLSTTTRTWQAADFQGNNLPTQLDGVQVTVNGKCAYVYYISPTQLNVPAPDDTAAGSVPVQVTNLQGSSNTVSAAESAIAPALFELANPPGTYVAAVRSDGMYLGPDTPAKPGDTILLFGTGFGPTAPPSATGQLVSGPVQLAGTAIVQINEINVIPTYSGLTGAGLYQFNVVVPNVPDGDRLVTVSVGDAVTPKLLLTVRH